MCRVAATSSPAGDSALDAVRSFALQPQNRLRRAARRSVQSPSALGRNANPRKRLLTSRCRVVASRRELPSIGIAA